jgi:hypothetical protein
MTRRAAALVLLLAGAAAAAACGKKGALLPPLVRTPQRPDAVTVEQRGATLYLGWKNPTKSIDGGAL